MPTNYKAELVALFGKPVAENPTGVMQEAAFAALGLNYRYLTIEVPPHHLPDAIRGMRAMGFAGANLTIPHKVAVIPFLDEVSREASLIGAVNTVRCVSGRLIGENTDGKGFLRGLRQDAGMDPAGKYAVLLGAGGAARAIATELLLAGVADLLVVNRSRERGISMVADLKAKTRGPIHFETWNGTYRVPPGADLLINATSVGLYPDSAVMPPVDLSTMTSRGLVADVVFNPAETLFLSQARARGLRTLDGLSMLVNQGSIGFEMWTGQPAPEGVMKSALAKALGQGL